MELAESVEIQIQGNTVSVEVVGSVLDEVCRQTDSQPRTHRQVGCLLSSAIACTLAKATGKLVTIQNETRNQETETTHIEYQVFEGESTQFITMQLSPLTLSDECARLIDTEVKSSVSEYVDSNVLDVEIAPSTIKSSVSEKGDSKVLNIEIAPNALKSGVSENVGSNVLDVEIAPSTLKSSVGENVGSNVLDVEIAPNALDYLRRYGDVFVLADSENPQYSYCKIRGVDGAANVVIEFEKFVLVSKADNDSQNKMNNSGTEFITKTFDSTSPIELMHNGLESYVEKSGFSTVDDWIRTLKAKDEIPERSTGNKMFYLYHIQAMSALICSASTRNYLRDKPRKSRL